MTIYDSARRSAVWLASFQSLQAAVFFFLVKKV